MQAFRHSQWAGVSVLPALVDHRDYCMAYLLIIGLLAQAAMARPITYDDLTPLANATNIKAVWNMLKLPTLPETFCHVGLLGWHCHNTTLQPWNPASLISKEQAPPLPVDASCVICPGGWMGERKSLVDVLLDLPLVKAIGKLPQGFYNMTELMKDQQNQPRH